MKAFFALALKAELCLVASSCYRPTGDRGIFFWPYKYVKNKRHGQAPAKDACDPTTSQYINTIKDCDVRVAK